MKIEVTRVVDLTGDGQVHACWPRAQVTLCGRKKVNWPNPRNWMAPIECQGCRDALLGRGIEELQDYIGVVEDDE